MSVPAVELDAWRVEGDRCPACMAHPPCPVWLVTDTRTCEPYPCRCDPRYGRCSYRYCPCLGRRPEPHLPATQCCAMSEANRRRWAQVDITSTAPEAPGASGGSRGTDPGAFGPHAQDGAPRWAAPAEGPMFDEDGFLVHGDDEEGDVELVPVSVLADHVRSEVVRPARTTREPYARRWTAEEVTCACPTPWDGEKRPGGLHCTGCHTNWKSASVMAMHQRRVTDSCRDPRTMVDVATGRPVVTARRVGAFVVWS